MPLKAKEYNLGTFDGLREAAQDAFGEGGSWPPNGAKIGSGRVGPVASLFCSTCGDRRRMFLSETYVGYRAFYQRWENGGRLDAQLYGGIGLYAVFGMRCAQCDAIFTGVMYEGATGASLCVLPSCYGGLSTRHAPEGVKFYCDQASRSASVGAYTAAIAMLRPAVDLVLESQGYTRPLPGQKLEDLERAIAAGTAPKWTQQYDYEFLVVLKKLANDANHTKQAAMPVIAAQHDEELYRSCEFAIAQLLEVIYERPERDKERLAKLRSAVVK